MAYYMFCIAHGQEPFQSESSVIDRDTGRKALESMRELWSKCSKIIYKLNPIGVAEIMSSSDEFWYCPFAYGYSNYCRRGFAKHTLTYADLPFFGSNGRLRSTIGGAGIAVSDKCQYKDVAIQFSEWICSGEMQSTMYVQHGGQPGHKEAWLDEQANILCNNFFKNVLPAMERGYVRPRYNGYLHFQDNAANILWSYLYNGGDTDKTLHAMDMIYVESIKLSK
jgi:multiple sugar transport system substrate-binding protein